MLKYLYCLQLLSRIKHVEGMTILITYYIRFECNNIRKYRHNYPVVITDFRKKKKINTTIKTKYVV